MAEVGEPMGANDKLAATFHGGQEGICHHGTSVGLISGLHADGTPCVYTEETTEAAWTPGARAGEKPDDMPMNEWVGQALGAASMCWNPRPEGVFDSTECSRVFRGLQDHINTAVADVIDGTTKAVECQTCGPCVHNGRHEPKPLDAVHTKEEIAEGLKPVAVRGLGGGAMLGLATTRQMLEELEARFLNQGHNIERDTVIDLQEVLSVEALDYRTVDES